MELVVVLGGGRRCRRSGQSPAATDEDSSTARHELLFEDSRSHFVGPDPAPCSAGAAGLPDPFVMGRQPRMEEFFGDVYYEVLESGNKPSPAIDAYRTLLRTYTCTLATTTSWFYDRPLGALGRWFRKLRSPSRTSRGSPS